MKRYKTSARFRITAAIFIAFGGVIGVLASKTPLLNVVGYELGFATGIFMAITGATLGIIAGRDSRRHEVRQNESTRRLVIIKYLQTVLAGCATLTAVIALVSITSYFIRGCNIKPGISLFFAICAPTLLNYSAAGLAAARFCRRSWTAALLLFAYFLATSVYSFALFMSASQSSLPNLTVGLVSLTGFYGFGLSIPDNFYLWRFLVLFMSMFFIGAANLAYPQKDASRNRMDLLFGRLLMGVAAAVFLICLVAAPDQTGLGNGRRTLNRELSERFETPHAVLHFSAGKMNYIETMTAARFTEWYIQEIREAIPMNPGWKVHAYLYSDKNQMTRLVGAPDFFFAAPWLREVHIRLDSINGDIYKHELAHAMMAAYGSGIFGTPYNIGVVEGTAEAIQNDFFRGPAFQERFAAAAKSRSISPAQQTMSMTGFGSTDIGKSYQMAGGFIGYLIYIYGPDKFTRFYAGSDIKKIYGKDLKTLNAEWVAWLKTVPFSPHALRIAEFIYNDAEFPAFYKTECPRVGSHEKMEDPELRLDKLIYYEKYDDAAKLCNDLFKKNSDPQWLLRSAHILQNDHRPAEALTYANRALAAKKIKSVTRDDAFLAKACALTALGKHADAISTLKERADFGFSIPDINEIMIRILESPTSRGVFQLEFCDEHGITETRLLKAINEEPELGPLYYLLAQKIKATSFKRTNAYSARLNDIVTKFIKYTVGLNKIKTVLLIETGDAYNEAGEFREAGEAYEKILPLATNDLDRFIALRRIERTRYFRSLNLDR